MLKDNHCLSQPSSLSPPSQVMMGVRTFSFLETTKSPPSSPCLFLCFFLQLLKTLPLPSSCRFPPLPQCLRCSQPRPWGFTVLPTPLQKALRMFFSSTYYHLSRLHNFSLALDLNFQTVLLSPAPRFPGLSAAMPCFHLTFRILDHIPNSQAPHLIPEALPELTRTSDLFSPLLRHSHLFSLNCGNSPRVLAKTHT